MNDIIYSKLQKMKDRFDEINSLFEYPEVLADSAYCLRLAKEKANLEKIVNLFAEYNILKNDINNTFECSLKEEMCILLANLENQIYNELAVNETDSSITVEIFPIKLNKATSALIKDLAMAYKNFCLRNDFECNISLEKSADASKNAHILIAGNNVKNLFENEIGLHTINSENGNGQIMVFAYKLKEYEAGFSEDDIKIDIYRSNGAGGQNVNKVSTAIRATHLKTGLVCTCQDERSQFQNKERAIENLKEKVLKFYKKQQENELNSIKKYQKSKFGAKIIRNYNYINGVVSDAKTKSELSIQNFINGDIKELLIN